MKKLGLLLALALLCALPSRAADFFYANTAQGGNTGADCANAFAWNDGTNGVNASAKQAAGNKLHLCGTITLGTAATFVTFVNSGASVGSPITLVWETGAILQATYWSSSGGIIANSRSFIVIDGGSNGIFQNTGNGDQLANQQQSVGVSATGSTSVVVKNLAIKNMFVHTAPVSITSITGNGTTATVTCAATCGLVTGEKFHVSNNANSGFNGDFTVASTSGTTLTYLNATNATGAGGSLGCSFGSGGTKCVDHNFVNAITISGTNNTIQSVTMNQCGFCVKHNYGNLDDNNNYSKNEIFDFDHGFMYATANSNAHATNVFMDSNKLHDTKSWDTPDCSGHHDGLHAFGAATNYGYTGLYFTNNSIYGDWGSCITAGVFIEGGASAANATNEYFYNNVVNITTSVLVTQGYIAAFSGAGETKVMYNTVKLPGNADLTSCYNIGSTNNTTIYGNVCGGAGGRGNFGNFTGTTTLDYNQWDTKSDAGGNCWIIQGSFTGCSFASYKTACNTQGWTGCDSHGRQDTYPLALNSDASPQVTFGGIKWGINLGSIASGNLASLQNDSTVGNTRTPLARPATATCVTPGTDANCWDLGAMQFAAGSPAPPPTPAQFIIAAYPLPASPTQPTITSLSPTKTYVTNKGCSQDGVKWLNPCTFRISCTNCDGTTLVTLDGTSVSQTYSSGVMTVTVPLSLLPVPSQITQHTFTASNPTNVPLLSRASIPSFRIQGN